MSKLPPSHKGTIGSREHTVPRKTQMTTLSSKSRSTTCWRIQWRNPSISSKPWNAPWLVQTMLVTMLVSNITVLNCLRCESTCSIVHVWKEGYKSKSNETRRREKYHDAKLQQKATQLPPERSPCLATADEIKPKIDKHKNTEKRTYLLAVKHSAR